MHGLAPIDLCARVFAREVSPLKGFAALFPMKVSDRTTYGRRPENAIDFRTIIVDCGKTIRLFSKKILNRDGGCTLFFQGSVTETGQKGL